MTVSRQSLAPSFADGEPLHGWGTAKQQRRSNYSALRARLGLTDSNYARCRLFDGWHEIHRTICEGSRSDRQTCQRVAGVPPVARATFVAEKPRAWIAKLGAGFSAPIQSWDLAPGARARASAGGIRGSPHSGPRGRVPAKFLGRTASPSAGREIASQIQNRPMREPMRVAFSSILRHARFPETYG